MTYLCVEFVQNVFEVVAFNGFFRVEQLQELLHELRSHVYLETAHFHSLVNHELQEELVDALQVGPGGVHLFFLVNACLREAEVRFLDVWQRSEDVFLDHLHHLVEVRDNQRLHVLLVLKHLLELLDGVEAFSLKRESKLLTFPLTSLVSSL